MQETRAHCLPKRASVRAIRVGARVDGKDTRGGDDSRDGEVELSTSRGLHRVQERILVSGYASVRCTFHCFRKTSCFLRITAPRHGRRGMKFALFLMCFGTTIC